MNFFLVTKKGRSPGATKTTPGKIEVAEGGVLFLDEVGDLPLALQAKLLRFLQEQVIERVGGRNEISVSVRVVCATHQDLLAMIQEGKFRGDSCTTVSTKRPYVCLHYTSAREIPWCWRAGSCSTLLSSWAAQSKDLPSRRCRNWYRATIRLWQGNDIRELENRIKRAVIMADGAQVTEQDLEMEELELEQEPF